MTLSSAQPSVWVPCSGYIVLFEPTGRQSVNRSINHSILGVCISLTSDSATLFASGLWDATVAVWWWAAAARCSLRMYDCLCLLAVRLPSCQPGLSALKQLFCQSVHLFKTAKHGHHPVVNVAGYIPRDDRMTSASVFTPGSHLRCCKAKSHSIQNDND